VVQDLASGDIQIQPSSKEYLQIQKNDTLRRLKRLGNPVKARYNIDPSISVGGVFLTKFCSQKKYAFNFFEKSYFCLYEKCLTEETVITKEQWTFEG